jgi:hypothetical protein
MAAAPAIFDRPTFTLADRLKIQAQRIREKDYIIIGRVTAIHWEAQRNISGFSQSRPRYGHPDQPKLLADAVAKRLMTQRQADAVKPFSEKQNVLWQSTTLDWLDGKRGPILARSRDQKDLLLPQGLTPLPDIPDPRWVPKHSDSVCPSGPRGCSGCIAPRIPQKLVGCPIVGDRVEDKITARNGHVFGILHPILELSVVAFGPDGLGHFLRIRGAVDQIDQTHPALLIDDEMRGFLVGGTFS